MKTPLEQQTPDQLRRTIFFTAVCGALIGTAIVDLLVLLLASKWLH